VVVLELAYLQLRDKKESKELVALAVRAAEALVRIDGGKDAQSLLRLADAYLVSGDKVKAKEYARRAIEAAAGCLSGQPRAISMVEGSTVIRRTNTAARQTCTMPSGSRRPSCRST
jgi:hypothetical protein